MPSLARHQSGPRRVPPRLRPGVAPAGTSGRSSHIGPRRLVHDAPHHAAEAVDRGGAGLAIGRRRRSCWRSNSRRSSAAPAGVRRQQPLAAIRAAGRLRDVALIHQCAQHAGERLLGDAQNAEQVGNGNARIAANEMQRAMMGAAEPEFLQCHVGGVGEVAIGEEQQVLRQPDVVFAEECQVGRRRWMRRSGFALNGEAAAAETAGASFDSGMAGIPWVGRKLRQLY